MYHFYGLLDFGGLSARLILDKSPVDYLLYFDDFPMDKRFQNSIAEQAPVVVILSGYHSTIKLPGF